MRVVIVSKTKMGGGTYCVGALGVDGNESRRLLRADGSNQPPDCPFDTGEVWIVEGRPRPDCITPHVEDYLVLDSRLESREPNLGSFLSARVRPWTGGPEGLFDAAVRFTGRRTGYISRDHVPPCSTGFWLPDRPLALSRGGDKLSFEYARDQLILRASYVGTQPPVEAIPAGTLVRLSLARWWRPRDAEVEERCYVQLSGWYDDVSDSFVPPDSVSVPAREQVVTLHVAGNQDRAGTQ